MTELAPDAGYGKKNRKLGAALLQHRALSAAGLSERLFGLLFSGLVYPQIWEDPAVDIAAMELKAGHRIAAIGSGGCNMLAYLSMAPAHVDVVDLNPHHVALNRLKLAAFRHLPGHADVVRFLARDGLVTNMRAYDLFIAPNLDRPTRTYWSGRGLDGRRRVSVFNRNLYRTGLLGRFIGLGHLVARLHGVDPREIVACRSMREQRQFFDERLAPLFEWPLIRFLTRRKGSLFGLGIPPQQYDALAASGDGSGIADVLRHRLEKLACHFPLKENYFAWQAFARRYPQPHEGELPVYLQQHRHGTIRDHARHVDVWHESMTTLLSRKPAQSVDRYVLLDAQDWMSDRQLNDLWSEITRTADRDAVVIFRTAAEESVIEGRLSPAIAGEWRADAERAKALGLRDRSAIYGGFHIYRKVA
ncbi:DUF3419 family protein [Ensifer soli]|uniref:DUF3419 family protein n=1 Tax=Ciceribacter sp. sgz301302 TaxID=3342379 RepID=UPI0035BA2516